MIINQRIFSDPKGKKQTFFNIEPFENNKFFFSMLNENGCTESKPYGITKREELEQLRDQLIELLR